MTVKKLEQNLGETGAYTDRSSGKDNLYDVIKAMAQGPANDLDARQDTVATGLIASRILTGDVKLTGLKIRVGTTGTAGSTTVQVLKNGVSQGSLTIANTDADGTLSSLSLDVDCEADDYIEINVSAAPTAGANLIASVKMAAVDVQ
jgi:hypothetical protein